MATDTTVNNLIINKLTKAQYEAIASPSETEIYLVPDEIDNVPTSGSDNFVKSGGVYTALGNKQDTLVSGTNIKTINNESILGNGNITIQGGGSGDVNVIETVKVNGTALTPDANKAVDITAVPASIVTQDATHRMVSDTEKNTWNSKTDNIGTITGITMNGVSKGTSGVVDLGTVITSHQDISGKQDTLVSGTNIKTVDNETLLGNGNVTTCIVYSIDASGMTSTKTINSSEPYQSINAAYTSGKTVYVRLYNFDASLNMPDIILPLISLSFNSIPYTFIMNLTVPSYGAYYANVAIYANKVEIAFQSLTLMPPVTSADNGKILSVVNGRATWVAPTTIYTGTGTPSSSQGVDGDIYLQTS